jgi:hypothetical protein
MTTLVDEKQIHDWITVTKGKSHFTASDEFPQISREA